MKRHAFFSNASIRIKLIVSCALVFVTVLLFSTITLYYLTKQTIERHIESELNNSTKAILNMVQTAANLSIRNHLQAVADKNKEIVISLYQEALTGGLSEEAARERAARILVSQSIGDTGYVYCVDSSGRIRVHPEASLLGKDLSGYPFIQRQTRKRDGYIEYEWKNSGDREERPKALYMTYFKPWDWIISASSYRDEFKDLISPADFNQSVLDLRFGKTGYSYVIDGKGIAIIHPTQPGVDISGSVDSNGRYFIRQMIREKNGRIIYPWKNPSETAPREKLVIFNYLAEYDMIVASSSYLEEFYRPLTTVRYIILLSALIAILLLIPFAMWLGDRIADPLSVMADRFQTAGEGDFSVRMESRTRDEIGRMATGFNDFMDRLELYRDDLADLNQHLEKRVEERTVELREALDQVKTLGGLLPICSACKKIRDDSGYWQQIETYIMNHSEADFTHSICPACEKELYSEFLSSEDPENP